MTFSAGASVGGGAVGAVGGAVGAAAGAVGGAVAASPIGAVAGAVGAVAGAVVGVASALGSLIPATLFCTSPVGAIGVVPFDFNPEKIQFTRSAVVTSFPAAGVGGPTPSGSSGATTKKTDPPTISINDLWFEGLTTKPRCDQLLKWTSVTDLDPIQQGFATLGMPVTVNPPSIMFLWGPPIFGFLYEVRLKQCTVSYERFNPLGIPVRAKLTLQMVEVPNWFSQLPTNPTSGGTAGRRTHVIKEGDSLQSIAMTHYARPGLWRQIASLNRINNPARIRPGDTIYLPGVGELTETAIS